MKRITIPNLGLLLGLALLVCGAATTQAADRPVLTVYTYDAFAAEWGPAAS